MGQAERHADPIILILLRQRRRLDLGWLLDGDLCPIVDFEILLTQAHGLEIESVPLTSLSVDRVEGLQGSIIQCEHAVDLALVVDDLGDGPRPAAQGHFSKTRWKSAFTKNEHDASLCAWQGRPVRRRFAGSRF